jgi:exodeoxyribonuclease V beta subunit
MAWLLHQSRPKAGPPECIMQELDSDSIRSALDSLNIEERTEDHGDSGVRLLVTELPADAFTFHDSGELLEKPQALTFSGRIEQNWQLTSFSGLTGRIKHDYRIDLPDFDPQDASRSEVQGEPAGLSRFTRPRGARAGECLHCILEELDFPQAGAEQVDTVVARKLDQFGFEEKWRCVVSEWMQSILETPLDSNGLTLRGISSEKRFVEMEFHYPLAGLTANGLNGVMKRPGGFRSDQMQLDFNPVNGMMKGFIDLIFEHQGRFYVLDYKSNHLGDHFDHYQRDNLQTAIGEHHYDLQYLIYTVALHRYLELRLPGYDYDIHFGGVYYLFLRGMEPRYGRERGVFHDRPESELISRLNRLFAGEESRV